MELKLTGRHIEITDAIRERIETKASKLPRYNSNVEFVDVVINGDQGAIPSIEIVVKAGTNQFFVVKEKTNGDQDFYSLMDAVFHKMERQLRKAKEKERNPMHS